MVHMSAKL
uniref:Uncharacterized protein n=1 Tax=Rhizophora mucronata TaxID=61149 RepID=A0A2P2LBX0_RHIMU